MQGIFLQWRAWQDSQGLSQRTITERQTVIARLITSSTGEPLGIEPAHIIEFCGRPGIWATTRATYHAHIRAFCPFLQRAGLRDDDPSLKTPRPKRPKSLPRPVQDSQLVLLLQAANRRRTRAYILLGALAGLRVHEIAKFRGEDIDSAAGTITVTGKGGKIAMLPAHDLLIDLARDFPREGFWFPSYLAGGVPHVLSSAVSQAVSDAMRRAGVRATPHALRHWYGTTLSSSGTDLRVVQTLMRPESPATTAIYTRVDFTASRADIDRLDLPRAA